LSLAFSTLVIALFALMPGFFFESFLYTGKMARVRAGAPTLTDLARSAGLSIPVHLLTLALLERMGLLRPVDFSLFAQAIAGQFGQKGETLGVLASSLEKDRVDIFFYLVATAAVGLVLGQIAQYLLLALPALNRLILFRNRWYYTFFFPQGRERAVGCEAFILTKTSVGSQAVLYNGEISDFVSNATEELVELHLSKARRSFLMTSSPQPEPDLAEVSSPKVQSFNQEEAEETKEIKWLPLRQDLFILPGDQIANVSLRYFTAWRPVLILARVDLTLQTGAHEGTINLAKASPWFRRFFLWLMPRPSGIFVISAEEDMPSALVEVDGYSVKLTFAAPRKVETRVQIVGSLRIAQHSLADKTGNLFFWVHNKVLGLWSGWIQRRATSWRKI
jgi:hypothetical protein